MTLPLIYALRNASTLDKTATILRYDTKVRT